MSKGMRNLARVVALTAIFVYVLFSIQNVVVPKMDWPKHNRRSTKSIRSLFQEERDSLDVLFFGSSFVFCGVSPMEVYRQSHLRGYAVSGPGQRSGVAYALLKALLKRQSPKAVVVDMGSLFKSKRQLSNSAAWQQSINSLPILDYADRIDMARELASVKGEPFDEEYFIRSVFPLMQYHDRADLNEYDFLNLYENQVYHCKGYAAVSKVKAVGDVPGGDGDEDDDDEDDDASDTEELLEAVEHNRVYYEKMDALCRENGCRFLMVKIPMNPPEDYSSIWTREKHDLTQQLADEMGVPFVDLNDIDIGMDWSTDTPDRGKHLNLGGATKVSAFLAKWLTEDCGIQPTPDDRLDAQWDYQLGLYDWEMDFYRLQMTGDLTDYLNRVAAGDYTLMVAASGGVGVGWTDDVQRAYEAATGSQLDLRQNGQAAYAAVAVNGRLIEERVDAAACEIAGRTAAGDAYRISSAAGVNDDHGDIELNGHRMNGSGQGLHFAVYSNTLKCVVDTVCFDTLGGEVRVDHTSRKYEDPFKLSLIEYAHDYLNGMPG